MDLEPPSHHRVENDREQANEAPDKPPCPVKPGGIVSTP
jgi:hypothetical protein